MSEELTLSQIETLLTEGEVNYTYRDRDYSDDLSWYWWKTEGSIGADIEGLGHVQTVDEYGGEGQGEEYWVVVKVTSPDGKERYFRQDGWYLSFDGGHFDGEMREVKPKTVQVVRYE